MSPEKGQSEVDSEAGAFEVLAAGVSISGLAHLAEERGMRIARVPIGERTLVVAIPKDAKTIEAVRSALDLAEKGAQSGPVVTGIGED